MRKKYLLLLSLEFLVFIPLTINIGQQIIKKKFETIDGKTIGIWPHNDRFKSVDRLSELKERWGFNHILLAAIYNEKEISLLKKAGFDSLHVMYQIYLPDYLGNKELVKQNIFNLGKIGSYYFDEPLSREQPFTQFLKLISALSDSGFYPHAKFIISEIDEHKAARFISTVDEISYSGYGDKNKLGLDQIETWKKWQQYLGDKFSMLWTSTNEDSNEYKTLFKAAHELGINSIWLYALEPLKEGHEVSDYNYENFCEAAVEFGFMKVKEE